jgi:glycosyltransferase involved in cell wall biosynthesis
MEIVFFYRNGRNGAVSIQENFTPLIEKMKRDNELYIYNVPYDGSNPIHLLKNILFIRKHSTKKGVNHISGDIHYGILGLLGRKSVLTIHDDYAIRQAKRGYLDKIYKWIFWIYLPIKFAKAPICTTPSTLRNIKNLYNSSKLRVITHHVVPKGLVDVHKPFNKGCPRLLQIGTANNKNLETTIKVVKDIKCKLIILKPLKLEQTQLLNEAHVDYENRYNLPYDEVIKEYQQCDVVLFPSLFEGLGVPIFEGQAAGKPVITTNKEPMNWTAGGGAVLLNDPLDVEEYRNKLMRIINDDDYRNDIVVKGKENVKRFSLDNAVAKYMELYKSL